MSLLITDHLLQRLRVRAPHGETHDDIEERIAERLRKKPILIRDGLTVFRVVMIFEGTVAVLLKQDGDRLVAVTALTGGQFNRSKSTGKYQPVEGATP